VGLEVGRQVLCRCSDVAPKGVARTPVAKEGQAVARGSVRVRVDELASRRRSLRVMDAFAGPRPCEPRPASCGPAADQVLKDGCGLDTDSQRPKSYGREDSHDRLAAEAANGFLLEDSA
jgi:hypothetical protein